MNPEPESAVAAASSASLPLREEDGWVTARPTPFTEVLARLVMLPKLVLEHRDLITTSVRRDLEIRFRGTLLGWIWPLIHPMFLFIVYYFIFTKLLNFKIPELPEGQESAMGIYMFCGIMAWAGISESLTRGTNVIVDSGNLIKKLAFPSEILPLNVTLVSMITFGFALAVFLGGCYFTPIWPPPDPVLLLWIPALLGVQALFTYGLVLLLSTLQVFLRDTLQIVGVVTTVWMFVTPLFWVPELMGESVKPYQGMIELNPVYHLVQAWRGVLMGEVTVPLDGVPTTVIDTTRIASSIGIFALWALGAYIIGYVLFILSQRRFADEV